MTRSSPMGSLLVPVIFLITGCGVPPTAPNAARVANPPAPAPAVAPPVAPQAAWTTFVYRCDEGRVVVRIEGAQARLFLPGGEVVLPRVPSASGARYAGGETLFWSKGEAALLEHRGRAFHGCVSRPAEAAWEDARWRGVTFRGLGNEPGWVLEMDPGSVVLVTDYGARRLVFPAVQRASGQAGKSTRYRTENGSHRLEMILEESSCRDDMSGEIFETTIGLELDGRVFRGCGRSLR